MSLPVRGNDKTDIEATEETPLIAEAPKKVVTFAETLERKALRAYTHLRKELEASQKAACFAPCTLPVLTAANCATCLCCTVCTGCASCAICEGRVCPSASPEAYQDTTECDNIDMCRNFSCKNVLHGLANFLIMPCRAPKTLWVVRPLLREIKRMEAFLLELEALEALSEDSPWPITGPLFQELYEITTFHTTELSLNEAAEKKLYDLPTVSWRRS